MDKQSTLHQLMCMRMNGIVNGITEQDKDYQALLQKVDKYSDRLESLHLPEKTTKLIDRYVSGYNAIGSRHGTLAYILGFSDCRELLLGTDCLGKEVLPEDSYSLSYTLRFEQQKSSPTLPGGAGGINGWGVQELLQQCGYC